MSHRTYRIAIPFLILVGVTLATADTKVYTAEEVLRHKARLHGKVISVQGFVRFDRLSQRGFLYRTHTEISDRNYRKTIFLELGNEGFVSLRIPDGSYVVVTGYLSKNLRGPLGAYSAHIIVDRMRVQHPNTSGFGRDTAR